MDTNTGSKFLELRSRTRRKLKSARGGKLLKEK
jgi:hypothetical protein